MQCRCGQGRSLERDEPDLIIDLLEADCSATTSRRVPTNTDRRKLVQLVPATTDIERGTASLQPATVSFSHG